MLEFGSHWLAAGVLLLGGCFNSPTPTSASQARSTAAGSPAAAASSAGSGAGGSSGTSSASSSGGTTGGGSTSGSGCFGDGGACRVNADCCAGACVAGQCGLGCPDGSVSVAEGEQDLQIPCLECVAGPYGPSWATATDRTPCSDGGYCSSGTCLMGCTAAGVTVPTGASCSPGYVCDQGSCEPGCLIDGGLYAPGSLSATNACEICNPIPSPNAWTPLPDATACSDGGICVAGTCNAGCLIGPGFVPTGTLAPGNACQVCDPAVQAQDYTSLPDGTLCDCATPPCPPDAGGRICVNGECQVGCDIADVGYLEGASNPADSCQRCVAEENATQWTTYPDGEECLLSGVGSVVCYQGVCRAGCWIDGGFIDDQTVDPSSACQYCSAANGPFGWSPRPTGAACDGGSCSNGTCVSDAG